MEMVYLARPCYQRSSFLIEDNFSCLSCYCFYVCVFAFVLPIVVVCVFRRRRYHRCLHLGHPAFSCGFGVLRLPPFSSFSSSSSSASSRFLLAVLAVLAVLGALAVLAVVVLIGVVIVIVGVDGWELVMLMMDEAG